MMSLDLFSGSAPDSDVDGLLQQGGNELAFVVGGAAHIRLRVSGSAGCLGGGGDTFLINSLSTKLTFGTAGANRGESHTAERDGSIGASLALHQELYGDTGAGINGS